MLKRKSLKQRVVASNRMLSRKRVLSEKELSKEEYEELLGQYGYEYLSENYPDDVPYEMGMLPEIFPVNDGNDYFRLLNSVFFGYKYNPYEKPDGTSHRESFNPNDAYFAFNGYANLVSIDEYDYEAYLNNHIDKDDFIDFCKENGYLEDDSEDEE